MEEKTCSKCNEKKPLSEFYKRSDKKDKYHGVCKQCKQVVIKNWNKNNPEKLKEHRDKYNRANKEYMLELHRQWTRKNKGKQAEYFSEWSKKNRNKRVATENKRRARLNSAGDYTPLEWLSVKMEQGFVCARCKLRRPLTVDHVVPLSKGGANTIDNIQGLCKSCNSSKGTKTIKY